MGAIVPLDLKNAFPSLIQAFLFLVLRLAGVYEALIKVTEGVYDNARAFASLDGGPMQFLFLLASGIMQGCPLSGTMFAITFDPFLRDLERRIDQKRQGKDESMRGRCGSGGIRDDGAT